MIYFPAMNGALTGRLVAGLIGALLVGAPAAQAATEKAKTHARPPKASIQLTQKYGFTVQHSPVTVEGRGILISGRVRPYVAGQTVTVSAFLGRHLFHRDRLRIKRSHGGSFGYFQESVTGPGVGQVDVWVRHDATSKLGRALTSTSFASLDDHVGFGSTGRFVVLLQQRLAALHFYIPQTGVYDTGTGLAIDAYHRLLRWGTSQTLDRSTVTWLLNGWGEFKVRYPSDGKHVEGNLGIQLLALIDKGKVLSIYPISSGKPSTPTVLGRFHVYRRTPGYLPDGMYYSSFFYGGYAIHGYNPAPDYPASHGCMRVPIVDAISIYNWLTFGDGVDVYY
jgi:hypothetical protein